MPLYYAVKVGRKPGIYNSWDETREQVEGFSGAIYRKFTKFEDACNFMEGINVVTSSAKPEYPTAYVDGSYTGTYPAAGIYIEKTDNTTYEFSFLISKFQEHYHIAGELFAAIYALYWAHKNGLKGLNIVHDYEGVSKFAKGEWKPRNTLTQLYKLLYDKLSSSLDVNFVRVPSHSGIKGNERADYLARKAVLLGNNWQLLEDFLVKFEQERNANQARNSI